MYGYTTQIGVYVHLALKNDGLDTNMGREVCHAFNNIYIARSQYVFSLARTNVQVRET